MNKIKNIVIATILLCTLCSTSVKGQDANTEDIITEPISSDETLISSLISSKDEEEQTQSQSPTAQWNNHLNSLTGDQGDQYWDKNSNTPTNDWKEEAISLAKEALEKDKSIAEALKSAFFNAITEKIKIEEGEFTASTYALIKEFDSTIDEYLKTLTEKEAKEEEKKEEEKTEPVVEPKQEPVEIETPPTPPAEEAPVSQPETTSVPAAPKTTAEEWNDLLEKITTEGSSETENKNLLVKSYELAQELLSQGYTGESLFSGFEYALNRHNANQNVFPIDIKKALEAFSAETGIVIPYNQQAQTAQQQYTAAMQKQAEQQEMAKKQEETRRIAMIEKAIEQTHKPEGGIQILHKKLTERLALEQAMRLAQQEATAIEIEKMKKELASLRKVKVEKAPEAEGIIGKTIGAVKGAATWLWYGEESQEQKEMEALNEARFAILLNFPKTKTLTPNEKRNWITFIHNLQSFKNLDTNDTKATATWLTTTKIALEYLTITHTIISIQDAMNIINDTIKQYPNSAQLIEDIETYLTEKQQKIIAAKEKEETTIQRKTEEKEQRKKLMELQKQKIEEKKERKKAEQNIIESYNRVRMEWQQLLIHIAQYKNATEEDNSNYTAEAIKKAEFLLHPTKPVFLKNKNKYGQKLKEKFTNALLEQQKGNTHTINIHQNMEQFNTAINNMS